MSSSNVERWRKDLDSYVKVKIYDIHSNDLSSVVEGAAEKIAWLRVVSRDAYGLNAIDDSYLAGVEETTQIVDEMLKSIRELPESSSSKILDMTLKREVNLLIIFMNITVIQLISLVQKKLADNEKITMQGVKLKEILAEQDKESKERIRSYVV